MELGKAIKMVRVMRGINLTQLAARTGLSPSYLSLLERNKRDPNIEVVTKIAAGLNVPLPILVFLAEDPAKFKSIDPVLVEKLAHAALELIKDSN